MLNSDKDIATLNTLINTTVDSLEGYAEAAKDAESSRFVTIFNDRAAERRAIVAKLQAEVGRLGGTPQSDGSTLGAVHRTFVNLKSTVTGNDDQAVVNEVERGEDYIKAKFETALEDMDLGAETRAVIKEAYTSVKQGHDQMRDLKHSLAATS